MKKIMLTLLPATIISMTSCGGDKQQSTICSGIDKSNLDTSVDPKNDFYQYACGGWMKKNPLTGEYARYGSFEQVGELNKQQMKDLIEDLATKKFEKGSVGDKLCTLYNLYMDSTKLNSIGIAPLAEDLLSIDSVKSKDQLPVLIADLHKIDVDVFFTFYIGADDKNSKMNMLHTYQSGLSLGSRDYYLSQKDSAMINIREQFVSHVERMFKLFGRSEEDAKKCTEDVMKIETALASSFYTKEQLRVPNDNYHKITYSQFKEDFVGFDWDAYFGKFGLKEDSINVSQIPPIKKAVELIESEELSVLKNYMTWQLIDRAATSLGDEIYNANFDFYGKVLSGRQEPSPRWKRAVSTLESAMGEAIGEMYVEKYFPASHKERMVQLVKNLQDSYAERLDSLNWMGDATKAKAKEKLAGLTVKIGYPDKFRDYTSLDITDDNLWNNAKKISRFKADIMLEKAGKPVDKTEWHMYPQTVNAYYNPSTNEICFPAGILQKPFFDMNADDAYNYGAIGVVIGHEMTHGYDDQGRQFDVDGNLKDWWTPEDAALFTLRSSSIMEYFNGIEVAPGVYANGKFTLGENLADHGGLKISFNALKRAMKTNPLTEVDGFTPEQRFFLSYAGVWANNIRPEEIIRRTKEDPHSLGKWRVNGAVPHINEWYDAFGVTEKDSMYIDPSRRANIW
ncbi:MAG: M13 family metallopeptidase [Bacteroidales bacterium]|nr:M13 family metallopeptidase [Candidatus Scybalocola fimicaballi]